MVGINKKQNPLPQGYFLTFCIQKTPKWVLLQTVKTLIKCCIMRHFISFHIVCKGKLECAVDGAPSQIPTLKFLTPQHPLVPTLGHGPSNRIKILFNIFSFICENTHKDWYKNLWNWHGNWNLMIIDLLTSTQGHQFDPRMKSLLAFCSACHPCQFDMPHDHVWNNFFLTPWVPPAPLSPTPGTWPRRQNENPVWYVLYLSFVRTHTKLGIKIFEIDMVTEFNDIWPFDLTPRSPVDHRMKILLAFCSSRHPRRFDMPHEHVWNFFFWSPGHPQGP